MIRLSKEELENITGESVAELIKLAKPEWESRKTLYTNYHRKDNASGLVCAGTQTKTIVPFEKFIVDTASGFLGGKAPTYNVEDTADEKKRNIIQRVLDKLAKSKDYKDELETIINYISNYNDDEEEHHKLVTDLLMCRSCYEIQYENLDNEIVYARLDPLNTIGVWDYNIPASLVGVVRRWNEVNLKGDKKEVVEVYTGIGKKTFVGDGSNYVEQSDEGNNTNYWKDVPMFAVELEEAIFEPAIDLIRAYEQLVQNTRNMFEYNDDAKLAISGYEPQNELTTVDDEGNVKPNPARVLEDKMVLQAKTMYFSEGGGAEWIEKNINDTATQNTLKTYIDLIMMNTGVPNTTDLGFTNADNASALDRKFFSLITMTTRLRQELKKAYLRRWELIIDRINLKKNTTFDFRDIQIELPYNMPANESELIDMWLKLQDVISNETIVNRLPLGLEYASEKQKMDDEANEAFEKNLEMMKQTEVGDELQGNRQTVVGTEEEIPDGAEEI